MSRFYTGIVIKLVERNSRFKCFNCFKIPESSGREKITITIVHVSQCHMGITYIILLLCPLRRESRIIVLT